MATLYFLLAYLTAQSNCVLCHSGRRRAHSSNRLCAYVSQMADHQLAPDATFIDDVCQMSSSFWGSLSGFQQGGMFSSVSNTATDAVNPSPCYVAGSAQQRQTRKRSARPY